MRAVQESAAGWDYPITLAPEPEERTGAETTARSVGKDFHPERTVVSLRSADGVQDAGPNDHETSGDPVGQPHVAPHRGDRVRDSDANRESDAGLDGA